MTEVNTTYRCGGCTTPLQNNETPCPQCGSSVRNIHIQISEELTLKDSLGIKKFQEKSRKFLSHIKQGWFPSGNKKQHPEGVQLVQHIDREKNLYIKKVVDEKTGHLVKDLIEPLDRHTN